jgi:hypothetical protein
MRTQAQKCYQITTRKYWVLGGHPNSPASAFRLFGISGTLQHRYTCLTAATETLQ